jgi:hypothetical protein
MMILQPPDLTRAGTLMLATGALALGLAIGAFARSADRDLGGFGSGHNRGGASRDRGAVGVPLEPSGPGIDGDTFEARVGVWPGLEITTKVRLRGIDAPELGARCPDEIAKAQAARDALAAILAEGAVGVSQVALDKYGGRVLADASTRKTPDVSTALLRAGLVRGYAGGRRESWC